MSDMIEIKQKKHDQGILGYYNLLNWWNENFSFAEKEYILEKYIPLGGLELIKGDISGSFATPVGFLTSLQTWFNTLVDEAISEKILTKAESLITKDTPILDIHFLFGAFIEHYYKKRNIEPKYYELAKCYCIKQIEISTKAREAFLSEYDTKSLPRHKGYEQLAIIYEKEKDYNRALQICMEGKAAGWNTDWSKKILNLENKMRLRK